MRCAVLGHHDEQESKLADQEDNYPSRRFSESVLDGLSEKDGGLTGLDNALACYLDPGTWGRTKPTHSREGALVLLFFFFFFLVLLFTFSCISSKFLRNLFLEQSSKHALTSGPLPFAFSVSGMISPQISSCLALSLFLGPCSNVTSSKTCLGYQLKHTTLHLLTLLPFPSQHLRSLPCVTCVCSLFHSITRI